MAQDEQDRKLNESSAMMETYLNLYGTRELSEGIEDVSVQQ